MGNKDISKKVAVVIGGSRGIGKAISLRLAQDGLHVLINFKSNKKEAKATLKSLTQNGGTGELIPFDITDRQAVNKAIEEIVSKYTLYTFVLCAGIRSDELLIFMAEEQWDSIINTNLTSFYTLSKPIVKHMVLNRTGRIIIISSTSGESGLPGQVHYSASKAGLIGATKALALECAKRNVLVNAITPGFISTEMTENINEANYVKKIPMNRFGNPEEVAGVVSFLTSNDSSYITGQVIRVNGGIYM